jgi:serine/threonine protein phosphatase PrpC
VSAGWGSNCPMVTDLLLGALEIAMRTDTGRVREHNEDSVFANARHGLAILADGMGGYQAGEVASQMATTLLANGLQTAFAVTAPHTPDSLAGDPFAKRCLSEQIARVNSAIFDAAESNEQFRGMGTTLLAAVFCDDKAIVAHVGDSRLYRLRGEKLTAITRDHSLLQEQIDQGLVTPEDARHAQNRNLVTRAMGVNDDVEAELHVHPVRPGDLYLLCSDGLYDMLDEAEIQHTLEMFGANLELLVTELIRMANDNGGEDNVSVVVVKVLHEFPVARTGWARLWSWLN